MSPTELSGKLLLAVKKQEPVQEYLNQLAALQWAALKEQLSNDAQRKAFWINIYNSFIQLLAVEKSAVLKGEKKRFFTDQMIPLAGSLLSFDDIEHGILRRGKHKYSLGYLKSPFVDARVEDLQVDNVDYRIHFALNCAARSCPPIAFYNEDGLDQQLDLATDAYLEQDVRVDKGRKKVHVTKLMFWFLGDFGGFSGIRNLMKEKGFIDSTQYKIRFNEYDWGIDLNNYSNELF